MVIVLINVCKENLHYYEFVKPVEDILENNFITKKYADIKKSDLENCSGVIICGTSLKDNDFLDDIKVFDWIKTFEKPILGICAGMQIMGLVFDGKVKNKTEIGFFKEDFTREFLGLFGEQEVYHLHNNFVNFKKLKEFEIICENKNVIQAVKHKTKEIYGVLFHPEVRQKDLIKNFIKLK